MRSDDATTIREHSIEDARAAALTTPRPRNATEIEELRWARAHPAGQVEWLADNHVALWNLDVGSADLKTEHLDGLRRLIAATELGGTGWTGTFVVYGITSTSGGEKENQRLSTQRAERAAAWLRAFGYQNIRARGDGETDLGAGGEAMARARSVEVIRDSPVIEPAPIPEPPPPGPSAPTPPSEPSPIPNPRVAITVDTWFPDPPIPTQFVVFQWGLKFQARLIGGLPQGSGTLSLTARPGAATVDYQGRLTEALKIKFGVDTPGVNRPAWMASAGLQWSDLLVLGTVHISPEAGVAMNDRLLPGYFQLNFDQPLDVDGLRFQVVGSLRVRFAPSPALLTRLLPAAVVVAPYLAASAVVAWAVASTALIAESAEWAREVGLDRTRQWARRDGFATRVAQELVDPSFAAEARARLDVWPRAGADPSVPAALLEAYTRADREFAALRASGGYDARLGQLRADYATTDLSFEGIRQAVFVAVGGFANEGPLVLELGQL